MRFNSQAYDKVFPRTTEVTEHVESSVETFKPSETDGETEHVVEQVIEPPTEPEVSSLLSEEPSLDEGGGSDGNRNSGELNNE